MSCPDLPGEADDSATELEIRSLLARLRRANDSGTVDEYLSVVADNAVLTLPGMPSREGLHALRSGVEASRAAGGVGPGSDVVHLLRVIEVTVDGYQATAFTPFIVFRDAGSAPSRPGPAATTITSAGPRRDGGNHSPNHPRGRRSGQPNFPRTQRY